MSSPSDLQNVADGVDWLRLLAALLGVGGLIGLFAFFLRLATQKGWLGLSLNALTGRGREQRLKIVETLSLDARRRLVIVSCDDREHLLLLGAQADMIVAALPDGASSSSPHSAPTPHARPPQ